MTKTHFQLKGGDVSSNTGGMVNDEVISSHIETMNTRRNAIGGSNQPGNTRRTSVESIPKLSDHNDALIEEMRRLQQETSKEIQASRDEVKSELKAEIRQISARLDQIENEFSKMNGKIKNLKTEVQTIGEKVDQVEREREDDQDTILRILVKQRENCLKLRGLKENPNENLYTLLCPILANYVNEPEEQFPWEIDRAYRISSRIAKLKSLPRDVVVYIVRKQMRDLVLNQSYVSKLTIEDQEVTILKDVPSKILRRCRDYKCLTDVLNQQKIPLRWDEIEGLTVTWNQKKIRLNSVKKAKLFLRGLKSKLEGKEEGSEVDRGGRN
ncbi:ubiquitin-like-conjugating enzyme ATG10 isoform X3 [Sceloporus undulatus]|nr:ubiquitin-like-conjugating enzyme ATG10 isoform X3 [Sceloporus undulatus]